MGSYVSYYWKSNTPIENERTEETYPIENENTEETYLVAVYEEYVREFSITDSVAIMWITSMFFANLATRDDYGNIYIKDQQGNYYRIIITK